MKRTLLAVAVTGVAVAGLVPASAAPSVYKVTGGGQILLGTTGAGSTIAFTAQGLDASGDDAKGQVQFVDRSTGKGQAQTVSHGTVTCVVVQRPADGGPAKARIQGTFDRTEKQDASTFTIDVIDNGQGAASEMDMVGFRYSQPADGNDDDTDDTCDLDDDFQANGGLGRGNVKIHNER